MGIKGPIGLQPSLHPLRPTEVALSPSWPEHPTLPVIINSLLITFKEVVLFLLGSPRKTKYQ
jgi:hypothetical protein